MGAWRDLPGDLLEVSLHGMSVGERHGQRRSFTAGRADGAKEVEALVALVLGLARSRALSGPLAHNAVLLAQSHLVLPPEFDRLISWHVADGSG